MTCFSLSALRLADAEREIADIWSYLEEHSVPSPSIRCSFLGEHYVSLQLTFPDAGSDDYAEVMAELVHRFDGGPVEIGASARKERRQPQTACASPRTPLLGRSGARSRADITRPRRWAN
jgi:hypothetical protein